ncbi:2361_t:CDS:2, partial [Funneliformis geosporum]
MDDDIKEIKQSSANASSVENPNNVVHLGKLEKMAKPSNTSDSTFNSNISLEDSVQKMPERLNENVSQRESDSGLVTEIIRDLLQGFLVDDFQREFINTEFIDREHSNSLP